jgi:pectate lyase
VRFDDPRALRTTVRFDAAGTYVLRLSADDGQDRGSDELTVIVDPFGRYEGYGAGATGGAGGRVVVVENLRDGGPGSFRAAVDGLDGTPTIITFAVGGEIFVSGEIRIARGNVTVMGSSAPDPGITLNAAFSDRNLGIKASNVIVENLRLRNAGLENIVLWGGRDIVIDHCSVTWSGDGALDINGSGYETGVNHVTISRSLFAGAVEVSRSRGHRISWHYNLFTHNNRRQPKIFAAGPDYNFVCNYLRAWGNTGINIQDAAQVNIVNNFFGPPYPTEQWEDACYLSGGTDAGDIYTAGNAHAASTPGQDSRGGYDINEVGRAARPFEIEPPPVPVTIIPAVDVPADVVADVGALPRDAHDHAFIHTYGGRGRETGGDPP